MCHIVNFIAAQPGMAGRMLTQHIDDGTGHCAGCTWPQASRPTFPCLLRYYAARAENFERSGIEIARPST